MARRSDIDWEAIEKDHRAGIMSIAAIAEKHGVSSSQIKLKAKQGGWPRGMSVKPAQRLRRAVRAGKAEGQEGFIYVFFIESADKRFYKIGVAKSPMQRKAQHQTSTPFDLMVACCYFTPNARAEEAELHEQFREKRIRGEWFALNGEDLNTIALRSRLA